MIVALRTRQQFDRVVRDGTRIRRAQLWCTWCPDLNSQHTSIAYSITRAVGPAVVRNRLRRRLRVILAALDREQTLPPVLLMLGARPDATELTFGQLSSVVAELISTLRAQFAARTSVSTTTTPILTSTSAPITSMTATDAAGMA